MTSLVIVSTVRDAQAISTDFVGSDHDLDYESAMWQWATFVKENICNPRATESPIASSTYHKETIISQYREMYDSWRPPFNSQSPKRFEFGDLRLARQLITVSSSFFGVLTVLYLDQNLEAGVLLDIYGAIDATHEAMSSFFALLRLFPDQMDMWGSYHTRAYAQAVSSGIRSSFIYVLGLTSLLR